MNLDLFDRLEKGEQDNVNHIINILYKWANVEFAGPPSHEIKHAKEYLMQEVYYFALYGVGSAITNKPNPYDVDLLFITNKFPNDKTCKDQPRFMDLVRMLEKEYIISINNNLEQVYDRESDARLKFGVDRKGFKSVDIIYQ